jgi:hypothetical protein
MRCTNDGANLLHVRARRVTSRRTYFDRERPLADLELASEAGTSGS